MEFEELPVARSLIQCCSCGCICSNGYSSSGSWVRSVKRKYNEFEDTNRFFIPGLELDYAAVVKVQVENEIVALREMVSNQQQVIQELGEDLEEERNASSSAANEAMSMILRLQKEKAEIQMEARQFKRFTEEKMSHDQQELSVLEDLLYKREQTIQSLTCEVQAYKHRMMSYGLTEAEADGEKGLALSRNLSMVESFDDQFDSPRYDYPPLRCSLNETAAHLEVESEVADIEKYAFDDTPRSRDQQLKNLEQRISRMERIPSDDELDRDISGGKHILEKVIVGQSPQRSRHSRRFSVDSSNSFLGVGVETVSEWAKDSPRPTISIKKMDQFSQDDEHSDSPVLKNASELGDDGGDRVYTIYSIHNDVMQPTPGVKICEDYLSTPRESQNRIESDDPDIQKLYMRLQALEADRESMRQAIVSMRTDNAQLILLKEIAQHLCKDMSPERPLPVQKPSVSRTFSFTSIFKWVLSIIFWRNRARKIKYLFGRSASTAGLLMLVDKNPQKTSWRLLTRAEM